MRIDASIRLPLLLLFALCLLFLVPSATGSLIAITPAAVSVFPLVDSVSANSPSPYSPPDGPTLNPNLAPTPVYVSQSPAIAPAKSPNPRGHGIVESSPLSSQPFPAAPWPSSSPSPAASPSVSPVSAPSFPPPNNSLPHLSNPLASSPSIDPLLPSPAGQSSPKKGPSQNSNSSSNATSVGVSTPVKNGYPPPSPSGKPSVYVPSQRSKRSPENITKPTPPTSANATHPRVPPPFPNGETSPSNSPPSSPPPAPSPKVSVPHQQLVFPPPPLSEDCSSTPCAEPYAISPGWQCACVLPMQVKLLLGIDLYTFFPLVSQLSSQIADGIFTKQSQVRIMGAKAGAREPGKTIVIINLVPLGLRFDNTTSLLIFQRFWHKKIPIQSSQFGDYEILYIHYPGLPPSPPLNPAAAAEESDFNDGSTVKPFGVDVSKKKTRSKPRNGQVIALISASSVVGLFVLVVVTWFLIARARTPIAKSNASHVSTRPFLATPASLMGNGMSSASMSFGSSIAAYTGSAKTFTSSDIKRATNKLDSGRILGEGGFGRVYSGYLDDGTPIAVKLLKRDDHQSGREFMAEIEMLSRLHHRNLVKLIGICTEEGCRCLVYELIPNGSVDSHLHGVHKDVSPLDWDARIKIALGSARGLAYLHEDSNPRVIHRDFKSSNILLEEDFTPKVSDFGLARTALEEESRHISTRVMGTFGYDSVYLVVGGYYMTVRYVAPEYAMTGHLLVKSDVYSYGVVLLELLTGRKPVDMSQPPGEENLVTWARPLLSSKEGLDEILDPSLGDDVSFDSLAKVAAIASMCVQPEVSHRPFMGEVVQALKLVCNECDEAKEILSRRSSHETSSPDADARSRPTTSAGSSSVDTYRSRNLNHGYDSEPDIELGLPLSEVYQTSGKYIGLVSGTCRRLSISGPITGSNRTSGWYKVRRQRRETVSDHGIMLRFWPHSD